MGNAIDIEWNQNTGETTIFTLKTNAWWFNKALNTAAQNFIFETHSKWVPVTSIHRAYNHPIHRGKVSVLKAYPAVNHPHEEESAINILNVLKVKKKLLETQEGIAGIYTFGNTRYITLVALAPDEPFLIYISNF